jgi:hypothetical protein
MPKPAKLVQIVLLVAMVAAGINFYFVMRERHVGIETPQKTELAMDPDYYVTPKKLHPQDLKDAKELTQQPVWVREGYRFTYYPFSGHADFQHPAGTLGPIEKLEVKDVVLDHAPQAGTQKQVMAIFDKDGRSYAFPIGVSENGNYTIYSDDILFVQDPHQLYKHWPADVWGAIGKHEVKNGMNELQASFAIGMGIPEGSGLSDPRIVNYPNNGHRVKVTFSDGKATQVQQGS